MCCKFIEVFKEQRRLSVSDKIRFRAMSANTASSFYTLDVTFHPEPSTIDVSPSHCQSSLTSPPPLLLYRFFHATPSKKSKLGGREAEQIFFLNEKASTYITFLVIKKAK